MSTTISKTTLVDGRIGETYTRDETKVEVFADGVTSVAVGNSVVKISFYSLIDSDKRGEKRELVAKIVLPKDGFINTLDLLGKVKEEIINPAAEDTNSPAKSAKK